MGIKDPLSSNVMLTLNHLVALGCLFILIFKLYDVKVHPCQIKTYSFSICKDFMKMFQLKKCGIFHSDIYIFLYGNH